jgi:hypothetical protein
MSIRISQAGLATGNDDVSRTDGLANGGLVTIVRTSPYDGTVRLVDVPPGDTTSLSTFEQVSSDTWTYTPTAGVYGSWAIEEVTRRTNASTEKQRRIFGVRLPKSGLLIPALNETADPNATIVDATAVMITRSDNNAVDFNTAALNARAYAGWWRSVYELFMAIENSQVNSQGVSETHLIETCAVRYSPGSYCKVNSSNEIAQLQFVLSAGEQVLLEFGLFAVLTSQVSEGIGAGYYQEIRSSNDGFANDMNTVGSTYELWNDSVGYLLHGAVKRIFTAPASGIYSFRVWSFTDDPSPTLIEEPNPSFKGTRIRTT